VIDGAGYADGFSVQLQDIFSAIRDGVYLDYFTPNAMGTAYSNHDGNIVGVQTDNTIFTTAGWAGLLDGDNTVDEYVMASISNFPTRPLRHIDYYNVYLDDDLAGQTTDLEYQYDTQDLVTGETYTGGVSAHYSSNDESETIEVEFVYTGYANDPGIIPLVTTLNSNYPNPFNPVTTISYALADAGQVKLDIYNVKGQKIRTLVNEAQKAGIHQLQWNGTDDRNHQVASGIYFYKMKFGKYTSTKKMILMK